MEAFPADVGPDDGTLPTGMICPDCSGNIVVRAVSADVSDPGRLVFQCRVGHIYTVEELLGGKEEHIERSMWVAVFAYEELAALLRDLSSRSANGSNQVTDGAEYRQRLKRAEANARDLRGLIDRDRAIRLSKASYR